MLDPIVKEALLRNDIWQHLARTSINWPICPEINESTLLYKLFKLHIYLFLKSLITFTNLFKSATPVYIIKCCMWCILFRSLFFRDTVEWLCGPMLVKIYQWLVLGPLITKYVALFVIFMCSRRTFRKLSQRENFVQSQLRKIKKARKPKYL